MCDFPRLHQNPGEILKFKLRILNTFQDKFAFTIHLMVYVRLQHGAQVRNSYVYYIKSTVLRSLWYSIGRTDCNRTQFMRPLGKLAGCFTSYSMSRTGTRLDAIRRLVALLKVT